MFSKPDRANIEDKGKSNRLKTPRTQDSSSAHLNQTGGHKSQARIPGVYEALSMLPKMIGISSELGRAELISKTLQNHSDRGREARADEQILCRELGSEVTSLDSNSS